MVIPKAALHGGGEVDSPPPFTVKYGWINGYDIAGCNLAGKGFSIRSTTRPLKPDAGRLNGVYKTFYKTLEKDVKKNGFRNPILIWGYDDGLWVIYGTTRAWLAEKLGIQVPAFICDFTPDKYDYKVVESEEEALSYFTDEPHIFRWEKDKYFNFCSERYYMDPTERKRLNRPQDRLLPNETFEF